MLRGYVPKSWKHGKVSSHARESHDSLAKQWTRQKAAWSYLESYTAKEKLSEEDVQAYKYWNLDHSLEDNFESPDCGYKLWIKPRRRQVEVEVTELASEDLQRDLRQKAAS